MLVRLRPSFQSHASPSSRLAPPSVPSPAPSGRGRGEAERRLSGGHTHPQLQLGTSHTHPQLDSCHAHPLLDQLQLHKLELAPAPGKHKEAGQADSAQLQVRCRPVTRALQTFPLSTLLQADERRRLDLSVVVLLCCGGGGSTPGPHHTSAALPSLSQAPTLSRYNHNILDIVCSSQCGKLDIGQACLVTTS